MDAILIHEGIARKVYALSIREGVPIYQDELFSGLDPRIKLKIVNYIHFLSDSKFPVTNKTISKKLKGFPNLYELLPIPVRLFFFMVADNAYITHGIVKKKNKTDKSELDRAETLKQRYFREWNDHGTNNQE